METYTVIVGNIGRVYFGNDKEEAKKEYDEYVNISKQGQGRAGGESVTLFEHYKDGSMDVVEDFIGTVDQGEENE